MPHTSEIPKMWKTVLITGTPGVGYETTIKFLKAMGFETKAGDFLGSRSNPMRESEWFYDVQTVFSYVSENQYKDRPIEFISMGGSNVDLLYVLPWRCIIYLEVSEDKFVNRANAFRRTHKIQGSASEKSHKTLDAAAKAAFVQANAPVYTVNAHQTPATLAHIIQEIVGHELRTIPELRYFISADVLKKVWEPYLITEVANWNGDTQDVGFLTRQWLKSELHEFVEDSSSDEYMDILGLVSKVSDNEGEVIITQFLVKRTQHVRVFIENSRNIHSILTNDYAAWADKHAKRGRTVIERNILGRANTIVLKALARLEQLITISSLPYEAKSRSLLNTSVKREDL